MPQALVTTKPNQPRTIVSTEFGNENGWVGLSKHFHLLGIWQWLAWNRLKFLSQLIASLGQAPGKRVTRRKWGQLEERRRNRESLRSHLKHYKHCCNCIQLAILVMLWISERQIRNLWNRFVKEVLSQQSQARTPKPDPVFLKGLSGFARTDSTTPAISF